MGAGKGPQGSCREQVAWGRSAVNGRGPVSRFLACDPGRLGGGLSRGWLSAIGRGDRTRRRLAADCSAGLGPDSCRLDAALLLGRTWTLFVQAL